MSYERPLLHTLSRVIPQRFFSIRRSTWIAMSLFLTTLFALVVWGLFALGSWLWSMARDGVAIAPEATRGVIEQVEKNLPGADQVLEKLRTIGAPAPVHEVSGTDPAPVSRYPGFVRTQWIRDAQYISVRYEGQAAFADVLGHYATGFAKAGYRQSLLSATSSEETYEYIKGDERIVLTFARESRDRVRLDILTRLH